METAAFRDKWTFRRPLPDSEVVCAAPFVTMEFGAYGLVQACCANAMFPIGDIRTQTLDEIWYGERADLLRSALRRGDLGAGCGVCRYRMLHTPGELPRDYYDQFGFAGGPLPERPRILTFSLHNTCNLECVMCGGDESSRIRSRRDGLAPLPHVYGDSFFEQLEPYLAACGFADFVGGEPFLVREHQRVWDLLISQDASARCSATTNGTVWNARVERVLEHLDFQITVSVDGISKETLESIRVGVDHAELFANIERFHSYTKARGTPFSISWSLVRQNWHELGQMMQWAEEREILVKVQTVLEPEFGVQAASDDELRTIVRSLEVESDRIRPGLRLNGDMWDRELLRLSDELLSRGSRSRELSSMRGPDPDNGVHIIESILGVAVSDDEDFDRLRDELLLPWLEPGQVPARLDLDSTGSVVAAVGLDNISNCGGMDTAALGRSLSALLERLGEPWGGAIWLLEEFAGVDVVEHLLFLGPRIRDKRGVVARMVSRRPTDSSAVVYLALSHALASQGIESSMKAVPVAISRASPSS